ARAAAARARAWVSRNQFGSAPCSWNIDSIVCCQTSSRTCISCSFPIDASQSEKKLRNKPIPVQERTMNKPTDIYARLSSDRQKENHTIASQTAALIEYAQKTGYSVPSEWVFQDEGYSGAILVRPGLEALRDLAAEGQIAAALVYSPDRLSRKYAYQVLLS